MVFLKYITVISVSLAASSVGVLSTIIAAPVAIDLQAGAIAWGGGGGGRVVRWCWVNFQCRGVLLIWITVGQGPTALAVGAGGGCLDIFTLVYPFSPLSPSLWETARYRLKYCLKGPFNPKQPTNILDCVGAAGGPAENC